MKVRQNGRIGVVKVSHRYRALKQRVHRRSVAVGWFSPLLVAGPGFRFLKCRRLSSLLARNEARASEA